MFSPPQISGEIAEKYPGNLIFCDSEALLSIAEDSWNSMTCRANCLAELLIRLYLNGEEKLQTESGTTTLRNRVAGILSHGEVSAFLYAVMPLKTFRPDNARRLELWNRNHPLSLSCRAALRERLRTFFRADGVIPVQSGDSKGWMIPFELRQGKSRYAVSDLDGNVIDEWNEAVSELEIAPYSVRVHCHAAPAMRGNPASFIGRSLMLPVWTAFQKKKEILPDYNPFKFVLSGAFDRDGVLSKVDINGKAAELAEHYRDALFLIPESCDISGLDAESAKNIYALPNELKEDLIPSIRRKAEQSQEMTLNYAIRRLPSLCDDVRYYHHGDWNEIIRILEATAKFDEDDNPMEYLLNLSLQSEAHCHNGNTKKALEINEKAYAFATEHGEDYVLLALRLQIGKLVLLTDEEDFDEIAQISPDLEKRIEQSGDPGLQMRYHGTMGQFCAYGILAEIQGCSKEQSLEHFKKAKDCAFKLGKIEDKRQDLNYLHLWHALFEPGTEAEKNALDRAGKMLAPQGEETEKSDNIIRNKRYLLRQQLLACYRLLPDNRETKDRPSFEAFDMELEGSDHTWIRALSYKYLGALESDAARREPDGSASEEHEKHARQCFENALQPLNENGPIIDLIRLTICCEAFRSTNNPKYRKMAEELITPLRETYPNQKSIDQWERFLRGQDKDHFPGWNYWY